MVCCQSSTTNYIDAAGEQHQLEACLADERERDKKKTENCYECMLNAGAVISRLPSLDNNWSFEQDKTVYGPSYRDRTNDLCSGNVFRCAASVDRTVFGELSSAEYPNFTSRLP